MVAKEASDPLKLTIVYKRAEHGSTTARIPALPRTISAGRSRHEARDNVLDALRLMLATPPESPGTRGHVEQVEIRLDVVRSHERDHGR
jgi:predicted RNase H-like HicB family nuclease